MLIVGGMGSVTGALLGTSLVTVLIEILRRLENGFSIGPIAFPQVFGFTQIGLCVLILAVLYRRPEGLLGFAEIGRLFRRPERPAGGVADSGPPAATAPSARAEGGALEVSGVRKRFGGLTAVDDVTLSLRAGEILGLIGPNGSGKTTLLGCIAGNIAADEGSIRISGREVRGEPAFAIARSGVARNFQSIRLFSNLTALENVKVAVLQIDRATGLEMRKPRPCSFWRNCGSRPWHSGAPATLPMDSREGSRSRAPWRSIPISCFWTSPPPA